MNIDFECRRCAGRGRRPEENEDCYVCLGKGRITLRHEEVKKHLHRKTRNDR